MKKISMLLCFIQIIMMKVEGQNIGIGLTTPLEKLHINGNIKADTVKSTAFLLNTNAGAGKILTSDATGNASWADANSSGAVGFGSWGDCSMNGVSDYQPVADTSDDQFDNFGITVAMHGNFAIVGANGDDINGNGDQGSANIYYHDGRRWIFLQKLIEANGQAGDQFGKQVAINENFAIIAVPNSDVHNATNRGAVCIYEFNGSTWVFKQKISDPGYATNDFFGSSVAISGNNLIVGIEGDDVGANVDQGSAAIFQFNGSAWTYVTKVYDWGGAAGDNFGNSVAISGHHAVIGAMNDDYGANIDQGSVVTYRFDGGAWNLVQKLFELSGATNDFFGNAVSISGNYLVVGAEGDDVNGNTDQGSAHVYQYSNNTWTFSKKLNEPTGVSIDRFGSSVFISSDYLIVGSEADNGVPYTDQGSATIFVRVGPEWQKLKLVSDPAGGPLDYFGNAVSIDAATKRFVAGVVNFSNSYGKVVFGKIN